jgi:hypothetical protein
MLLKRLPFRRNPGIRSEPTPRRTLGLIAGERVMLDNASGIRSAVR